MYANHQPQLSHLGRNSADGFARIATFVLCTIRTPLRIAVEDYKQVRNGDFSPLFGMKRTGISYINKFSEDLYSRCEYVYETADDETAENAILHILMNIPGIGPAKAGFICQMIYGLSGCLDTHNIIRFGIPERTFRGKEAKYSVKRLGQTVRDYNSFCRKVGGTAVLWDQWCEYVSNRDPVNYPTPERVSELHLIPCEL